MSDVSSSSTTYTGMSGAGGGSLLRLTGMATGLDVDGTVKKMMAAEQTKLDKVKQDQQTIQWKQEAYQDIIKQLKELQGSFFDSASSDKNILSSTNLIPFTVSGVGTTSVDTSIATLTPGSGGQAGKYTVIVNQLATGAGLNNTLASGTALTTKLTDLGLTNSNIYLTLNVNGNSNNININLDNSDGTKTIGDLINALNNQSGGIVKASFSELTGQFKLNTSTTGESSSLTIVGGTDLSGILGSYTLNTQIQNGKNANVTITSPNGTGTITRNSNSFALDGINYNLSSTGTVNASIGLDSQKVYDKIKAFVDKYNTIVDNIQTKLSEKKNSDYKPLTDSQKASMSDSQVAAWETKSKVGILRNDTNLQNMLNDLRSAFTTAVNNVGLSIGSYGNNSIGIDFSSDYSQPSHIEITDESKLKNTITNYSDQLIKMFTNVSKSTDGISSYNNSTSQYREDGIFTRINRILQNNVGYTNTTLNNSVLTSYANKQYDYSSTGSGGKNTLPDQLYEQQLLIKKITSEMSTKQENYYQMFSKLETAMNQLNSQQSMLTSMLSG